MALAVDQIIAQLQGEDDDVDEDMDGDDIEGMENEEELPENFIENVKLELIDGNKNEKWLVIDEVHIVFKHTEWNSTVVWRCSGRRRLGCPFYIVTTKPSEAGEPVKAIRMSDPEDHSCSADKIAPLLQKFRSKLAKRMVEDLDLSWKKVWDSERALLLDGLKDNPEMYQQVLLEMSDVEAYRKMAQRAREKVVPKIPREHKDMDPEKVCFDVFFFCIHLYFQVGLGHLVLGRRSNPEAQNKDVIVLGTGDTASAWARTVQIWRRNFQDNA